jgi:hypothetical protein
MTSGLVLLVLLVGCATTPGRGPVGKTREFATRTDGFCYTNELVWEYHFDDQGRMTTQRRDPPPTHWQRCFAMSLAARQFFAHAEFRPDLPKPSQPDLEKLVRQVLDRGNRTFSAPDRRLVIPGYTNLWHLSTEQAALLKARCGKPWQAYVQRGNWRMVFPFSRAHQARTAGELEMLLVSQEPLVVHLVCFPELTINHAVAVFHATPTAETIEFQVYDPNIPGQTIPLTYDRATRTFHWPRSIYFYGGKVDVYRIYKGWCY